MNRLLKALGLAPTHPFRKLNLFFLMVTVSALVFAIVLEAMGASGMATNVLWLAGWGCAMTLILALSGLRHTRDIDRILAGQYIEKWIYTPGEWERFAGAEAGRQARDAYYTFGGGVIGVVALFALAAAAKGSTPSTDIALAGGLVGLAVTALMGLAIYSSSRTLAADAGYKNRTIYIGHRGVLKPWGYMPVTGFNLALAGAAVDHGCDPPELVLTSTYWTRYGSRRRDVRVPVPRGHEKEVPTLVDQLRGKSISNVAQ